MAPTPSSDSLTSLYALQDAARKNSHQAPELSLPERPRNFQNDFPYSDAAIGVVSVYTTHLYNEHGSWLIEVNGMRRDIKTVDGKVEKVDHKVDRFEQGARGALSALSVRLDEVETDLKGLKKEVKDVQSQVKDVQSQVESLQRGIENGSARQINALRNRLKDSIEPIYAPALVAGKQTFVLSPDFPRTVADCWRLLQDTPALVRLAKHYSVTDWERWQRGSSDDTERTDYVNIEDAVTAHPRQCWKILVSKWGLQHIDLERPRKRLAETDDESEVRRVRLRRTSGSDICESVFSRNEAGELTRQVQITRRGPPQSVPSDSVITHVYEKYAGASGPYGRVSFESAELGWDANMKSSLGSGKSRHS
ncbi:uncharacterized protein BJX67DRAFT_334995 [Aspergillus lucknowensis]|uniref:Uncharacterized protein n=1 Tax=Aspergillus lucknowensis TaxID=176173 RepID=A0ABR4L635_9EURO